MAIFVNRNLLSYENVLNEAISIMKIDFISDIQQKEELFKKYNDISKNIFNSLVINKLLNKLDELDLSLIHISEPTRRS